MPRAQVCLAAETCKHVDFSVLEDTWYSAEPLHCTSTRQGAGAQGDVSFWDIYRKVGPWPAPARLPRTRPPVLPCPQTLKP